MGSPVNFFEIGTPDPAAAQRFYGTLFDWSFGEPSPVGYRMVDRDAGGLWDSTGVGGGSWAIFYVQVEDVKAAITQAEALGATVAVPYVDNGRIEFAHLVDPQGHRFGVWHPKSEDWAG
jgi:predicted enzyme related to lactoylglutathione lyase